MLSPTEKVAVRRAITSFCLQAEANRLRWYYAQIRPYTGLGVPPDEPHTDDCSAYVALAFWWAMHTTKVWLADPLGENWRRIGYTGTQLDFLRPHPAPVDKYLVGDMAIFGEPWATEHTTICRKAGTRRTAIFSSNGHQNWIFRLDAPEPTTLATWPQHEVGVFRHPALI